MGDWDRLEACKVPTEGKLHLYCKLVQPTLYCPLSQPSKGGTLFKVVWEPELSTSHNWLERKTGLLLQPSWLHTLSQTQWPFYHVVEHN